MGKLRSTGVFQRHRLSSVLVHEHQQRENEQPDIERFRQAVGDTLPERNKHRVGNTRRKQRAASDNLDSASRKSQGRLLVAQCQVVGDVSE